MGILANGRRRRWRSEQTETPDPRQQVNRRLLLLYFAVFVAFAALTVQLARLQLIRGAEFEQRAALNQLRVEPAIPARGLIYDRNGVPVVENVPSFSAALVAADVPEDRTLEIAAGVEALLGVPAIETTLKVEQARRSNDPFSPVIVKDGLDRPTAFRVREELAHLPGVQVVVEPVRHYVEPLLSTILGYTGRVDEEDYAELKDEGYLASDRLGKAGVEAAYERYLRGVPGTREVEKDATGREIRVMSERPAIPGNDLYLSLDLDLQKKATELLQAAAGGSQAAAVVMDVHSGEVLALVSLPMYDNNIFSGKIDEVKLDQYLRDPKKPLVNHALAEQYPPGSIFKQITGLAALQEGVATTSTTITSNGFINVPNQYDDSIIYTFRDWAALGTLDFYGGVAMSSDVYFYHLAGGYHEYGHDFDGLGIDRLALYTRAFGLGRPTGIDIAGEAPGNVPDPAWKEETFGEVWTVGDTYNMGIGQGYVATTPLQMALVTATIANGGDVLVPRVVKDVVDTKGAVVTPFQRTVRGVLPVDPSYLDVFREAMRQAVSWGTAKDASVSGVQVAGKTGTAEFGEPGPGNKYESHAWFSGFAPFEDPQVAIVVFLEKGNGAKNAAPTGARILDYYFHRQVFAAGP